MNDIIPAKNYSLHKHRFYAIQKINKYKNLYLIQITKRIQKHSSLISYTILLYLDIQK